MEKHAKACNDIIKELCVRKAYNGEAKQIIVTSRTWQPFLATFLNESIIADSVLLIGNHLEAAIWGGVSLQLVLCDANVKLKTLTGEYICGVILPLIEDNKH